MCNGRVTETHATISRHAKPRREGEREREREREGGREGGRVVYVPSRFAKPEVFFELANHCVSICAADYKP